MKLIDLYHSNPQKYPTDKESSHSYISSLYSDLFAMFQYRSNVLEIGVQEGYSINLWSDYFIESNIYGLEIDASKVQIPFCGKNYNIILDNAYTEKCVWNFNEQFDIIIDDGPHTLDSWMFTLKYYRPLLKQNGVLIIEDIRYPEHATILRQFADSGNILDLRCIKNRFDDILFVLRN